MKIIKEVTQIEEVEVPLGIFLSRTSINDFWFIAADGLIVKIDYDFRSIHMTRNLYSSDRPEDYKQITRTEFQNAFAKAFANMQKYHSLIQAAPELIDQDVFEKPLAADHAHLITNQTESQS